MEPEDLPEDADQKAREFWERITGNHWKLNPDHTVEPCSLLEWGTLMETPGRILKQETVRDCFVSTVFLGLDYSFDAGPPLLFETMVFSPTREVPADDAEDDIYGGLYSSTTREGGDDMYMVRTPTWDLAMQAHEKTADLLRKLTPEQLLLAVTNRDLYQFVEEED